MKLSDYTKQKLTSVPVWLGVLSVLIISSGIDPSQMVTWQILGQNIISFLSNPFMFFSACVAIYSFWNNPNNKKGV
jgi:hypothetical protein